MKFQNEEQFLTYFQEQFKTLEQQKDKVVKHYLGLCFSKDKSYITYELLQQNLVNFTSVVDQYQDLYSKCWMMFEKGYFDDEEEEDSEFLEVYEPFVSEFVCIKRYERNLQRLTQERKPQAVA